MKTETLLEECLLLAHRINKLGGCVFITDYGHVNGLSVDIAKSKKRFSSKSDTFQLSYDENRLREVEVRELHDVLTKKLKWLKDKLKYGGETK